MTGSRAQAGFSLVELLIVMAILGIMAAIGVPSFRGLMPRIRLNNDAMVLSNEIALARVRAISKSNDFRIVFDDVNDRYALGKIARTGSGGVCLADGTGSPCWLDISWTNLTGSDLRPVAGFNTASILPAVPDETLVVSGRGAANVPLGTQAAIELRTPGGDHRRQILVEPTGRMIVRRWSGGAWAQE
jgi:prepilin-type N-terminal cleavage/methylation domain-containing protein